MTVTEGTSMVGREEEVDGTCALFRMTGAPGTCWASSSGRLVVAQKLLYCPQNEAGQSMVGTVQVAVC